jgi:uncharacterized tellurite resistance protein B-like protein
MTETTDLKNLMKILIGTAWIDGEIQPEERTYLHRVAQEKGIADDPDIQPLLQEFKSVNPTECYGLVKEYLGTNPTSESCQHLIEAISALIYSDGNVANEEAKLLNQLQLLDPANASPEQETNAVLKSIQELYRRWIAKL